MEIFEIVNIFALLMGLTFGAIAQKTQFCFSGSIKDYMLFSSTRRGASVVMAMITAIVGTYLLTLVYEIDLSETVWLKEDVNYFTIILGGMLFGSGMVIADGCSSRHLVKFAQGDNKSLVTVIFIAIFAFASMKGVLSPIVLWLTTNEILMNLSSFVKNVQLNIFVVLFVLLLILAVLTKKFKRVIELKDGFFIGLLVVGAWYLTGVYGAQTLELDTRYVNFTAITFVGPSARSLAMFTNWKINNLDFGIVLIFGVLIGAFIMSRFNRKYSFGCVSNIKMHKLTNSMAGGALMGVGGVLAIGCTVGQGLSGLSTLAVASFVAIVSIFISGMITASILNKKKQLPMCFVFEWNDEKKM
ncbi:YeeE/YedE family protein [hydrothermal vent metagenome]|uniref:YeeE/YedE family protein n=1 Tax=hydrothermal vent metagenome TaxID=652676 RepID=A0A1W1EC79_9ZZZZ